MQLVDHRLVTHLLANALAHLLALILHLPVLLLPQLLGLLEGHETLALLLLQLGSLLGRGTLSAANVGLGWTSRMVSDLEIGSCLLE